MSNSLGLSHLCKTDKPPNYILAHNSQRSSMKVIFYLIFFFRSSECKINSNTFSTERFFICIIFSLSDSHKPIFFFAGTVKIKGQILKS